MKFTHGNLTAKHGGEDVELTAFEKLDVVLGKAGRIEVSGAERGSSGRAMKASCVLEPGGVSIGERAISLRCERAEPPDGGPPVKNVTFSFWNEAT